MLSPKCCSALKYFYQHPNTRMIRNEILMSFDVSVLRSKFSFTSHLQIFTKRVRAISIFSQLTNRAIKLKTNGQTTTAILQRFFENSLIFNIADSGGNAIN